MSRSSGSEKDACHRAFLYILFLFRSIFEVLWVSRPLLPVKCGGSWVVGNGDLTVSKEKKRGRKNSLEISVICTWVASRFCSHSLPSMYGIDISVSGSFAGIILEMRYFMSSQIYEWELITPVKNEKKNSDPWGKLEILSWPSGWKWCICWYRDFFQSWEQLMLCFPWLTDLSTWASLSLKISDRLGNLSIWCDFDVVCWFQLTNHLLGDLHRTRRSPWLALTFMLPMQKISRRDGMTRNRDPSKARRRGLGWDLWRLKAQAVSGWRKEKRFQTLVARKGKVWMLSSANPPRDPKNSFKCF